MTPSWKRFTSACWPASRRPTRRRFAYGTSAGSTTRPIDTNVAGIRIAEHWTKLAGVMNELAVIRSMTSKEGNHGRATYLLHTSYPPSGGIVHPGFGTLVAKELGDAAFDLPQFVSI